MAKQHNDYRESTGKETYWTNAAFGGMPTYQLGAKYPHNYIKQLDLTLRFLPRPADYLFLYFIGMYILFLILKVDYKLAFISAEQIASDDQIVSCDGFDIFMDPDSAEILDEATEGLAPLIRNEIWNCVRNLKSAGQSILLVDKNIDALTQLLNQL